MSDMSLICCLSYTKVLSFNVSFQGTKIFLKFRFDAYQHPGSSTIHMAMHGICAVEDPSRPINVHNLTLRGIEFHIPGFLPFL